MKKPFEKSLSGTQNDREEVRNGEFLRAIEREKNYLFLTSIITTAQCLVGVQLRSLTIRLSSRIMECDIKYHSAIVYCFMIARAFKTVTVGISYLDLRLLRFLSETGSMIQFNVPRVRKTLLHHHCISLSWG